MHNNKCKECERPITGIGKTGFCQSCAMKKTWQNPEYHSKMCIIAAANWDDRRKEKRATDFSGDRNPKWKGGIAEYINHADLKRARLDKLKLSSGKCEICGDKASLVHHIDGTKENHSQENLAALCVTCHWAVHSTDTRNRNYSHTKTTKYVRIFGKTLTELGKEFNVSGGSVLAWIKTVNSYPKLIRRPPSFGRGLFYEKYKDAIESLSETGNGGERK